LQYEWSVIGNFDEDFSAEGNIYWVKPKDKFDGADLSSQLNV
jgi:hypothetical protein